MQISISQLDRDATTGGVKTAHWRSSESETASGVTYTAGSYGTCSFTPNPQDPAFKPYEDLTEAEVIAWVEDTLGEDTLEAMQLNLTNEIARQKNPPVLSGTPW